MGKLILLFSVIFLFSSFIFATPQRVAIIDSGFDFSHDSLFAKRYINQGEVEGNDYDDDGNGFKDDVNGYNFADDSGRLFDFNELPANYLDVLRSFRIIKKFQDGEPISEEEKQFFEKNKKYLNKVGSLIHGTHVAGIAVSGFSVDEVKVVGIKIPLGGGGDDNGPGEPTPPPEPTKEQIDQEIKGYITQNRAYYTRLSRYLQFVRTPVANCSWGISKAEMVEGLREGNPYWKDEIIQYIADSFIGANRMVASEFVDSNKNVLFIVAAGNSTLNNDISPTYPAALSNDNIVTVAAVTKTKQLAEFSNWGLKSVDVAALGVGIESSVPQNQMAPLSGTSQASPNVANVAMKILVTEPTLTPSEMKSIIMATVDPKSCLNGKIVTSGVVNARRAVVAAKYLRSLGFEKAVKLALGNVPLEPRSCGGGRRPYDNSVFAEILKKVEVVRMCPNMPF